MKLLLAIWKLKANPSEKDWSENGIETSCLKMTNNSRQYKHLYVWHGRKYACFFDPDPANNHMSQKHIIIHSYS